MALKCNDENVVFEDQDSYSVVEKSCMTCKYFFKEVFPKHEPCVSCMRCAKWESHIEEVKFDKVPLSSQPDEELPTYMYDKLGGTQDADKEDLINHPPHYTSHPSGVECIQITEHMGFNLGNALKYIWRADLKWNRTEDIKKAIWYLERELNREQFDPETIQKVLS